MKYVILHDIRSAHNVGAIFRTADGAGVQKIYLTGYTPTPQDRFGRPVPEIIKTSLGATATVAWEQIADIFSVIKILKDSGISVVAVEQASSSVSLYDFKEEKNTAYVFGNEVLGVDDDILLQCDVVLEIPMSGSKESLNVSVTAGIVLFHHQNI